MRTEHTTLTRDVVQGYAQGLLRRHLKLKDHGPKVTASSLYTVVLFAAATASTIARVCRSLFGLPSKQSIYNALDDSLPERLELQRRINRSLRDTVPKAVRLGKRAAKVAIDINLAPYYGNPDPQDDMVYKGQEKASTNYHHAYATAYLVRKGRRFTLAVLMVRHDTPWDQIVRDLLRLARKVVPAIELVLVDRGFYSVAVIRYLHRARYPFIMPVIARGRDAKHPKGPSGSKVFSTFKRSGWSRYTLQQGNSRVTATVDIAVKVLRKWKKRPFSKKKGKRVLVYACWRLRGRSESWAAEQYRRRRIDWLRQSYRGRFGIETSYRQMNQGLAWTTSKDPRRRLLLVGLALLLRNIWALLHLTAVAVRRRTGGAPLLRPELLPLADMLDWIADAIKQTFGCRHQVQVNAPFLL
jgi:putative transposase